MMKRMSGLDAMFLGLETPRSYMHTFKIAILDPATCSEQWSYEWYRDKLERLLYRIPQFRWRYLPAPLGISHPLWVEDPDFFLGYHIRHISCPPPGDHRAYVAGVGAAHALRQFYDLEATDRVDPGPEPRNCWRQATPARQR